LFVILNFELNCNYIYKKR